MRAFAKAPHVIARYQAVYFDRRLITALLFARLVRGFARQSIRDLRDRNFNFTRLVASDCSMRSPTWTSSACPPSTGFRLHSSNTGTGKRTPATLWSTATHKNMMLCRRKIAKVKRVSSSPLSVKFEILHCSSRPIRLISRLRI